MENNIVVQEKQYLSSQEIRGQVGLIQSVLKDVMQKDVHYGVVNGCGNKPTLLKPGAEKIMSTFRLCADPVVSDLSTSDEIRYRVTVRLLSASGNFVGSGIGECSTNEEKYKWRRAICDEEYADTPEDRRREKYSSYQGKVTKTKQVRTNPSDLANTVLKMAKKRGLVDAVLTCTACSDIFTQDIEDLPEELLGGRHETTQKPSVKMPEAIKKEEPAKEPIKEPVKEKEDATTVDTDIQEYFTPTSILTCPEKSIVNLKGTVEEIESRTDSAKKLYQRYHVTDGANTVVILLNGEPACAIKDVCVFCNVLVGSLGSGKIYRAESVEVVC